MTIRTIRKYILNPGIEDVRRILASLLAFSSPVYTVGESDGYYRIKKMETSGKKVRLSSARCAGSMWLEGPNTLCVDSSDLNVLEAVENANGVSPLEKYKH